MNPSTILPLVALGLYVIVWLVRSGRCTDGDPVRSFWGIGVVSSAIPAALSLIVLTIGAATLQGLTGLAYRDGGVSLEILGGIVWPFVVYAVGLWWLLRRSVTEGEERFTVMDGFTGGQRLWGVLGAPMPLMLIAICLAQLVLQVRLLADVCRKVDPTWGEHAVLGVLLLLAGSLLRGGIGGLLRSQIVQGLLLVVGLFAVGIVALGSIDLQTTERAPAKSTQDTWWLHAAMVGALMHPALWARLPAAAGATRGRVVAALSVGFVVCVASLLLFGWAADAWFPRLVDGNGRVLPSSLVDSSGRDFDRVFAAVAADGIPSLGDGPANEIFETLLTVLLFASIVGTTAALGSAVAIVMARDLYRPWFRPAASLAEQTIVVRVALAGLAIVAVALFFFRRSATLGLVADSLVELALLGPLVLLQWLPQIATIAGRPIFRRFPLALGWCVGCGVVVLQSAAARIVLERRAPDLLAQLVALYEPGPMIGLGLLVNVLVALGAHLILMGLVPSKLAANFNER